MELELFSGEDMSEEYVERLTRILNLKEKELNNLVRILSVSSAEKDVSESDMGQLRADFGTDDDDLINMLVVAALGTSLRILSGKTSRSVQDDLINHGFPEDSVRSLFSLVTSLEPSIKETVKYWATEGETALERNHVHGFSSDSDFRVVDDAGVIISVMPISNIRIRVSVRDEEREKTWRLESTYKELTFLIGALEGAKRELETSMKDLKNRLGEAVVAAT